MPFGFGGDCQGEDNNNNDNIGPLQQPSERGNINWEKVCKALDLAIAEPYNTLAHGTKLTPLGEHVIRCFAAGGLLLLYDPSGDTLAAAQALAPAVGCGGGLNEILKVVLYS